MQKNNFIYGIALSSYEIDDNYKEKMKSEYDLTDEDIAELKLAHMFLLADNVRYTQFDADIVLFSEEKETYYHTGDFEPIAQVENKDIVALANENSECELI